MAAYNDGYEGSDPYEHDIYVLLRNAGLDQDEAIMMSKIKSRRDKDPVFQKKIDDYVQRYGFGFETLSMLKSELGISKEISHDGFVRHHDNGDNIFARIWNAFKEWFS